MKHFHGLFQIWSEEKKSCRGGGYCEDTSRGVPIAAQDVRISGESHGAERVQKAAEDHRHVTDDLRRSKQVP